MKRALWLIAALNALRLALSFTFELTPQEAYYAFYAQHLSLSYFDHPPAIAVFLRAFTAILGRREVALRLTAFTLTCALQCSFLQLLPRFLPRARRGLAALLFVSTGMVTVLSLISLPDVPLLLFWCLSLQALASAIFDGRRASWVWAGLCMGLAFDSKYTGLLLQLGLLLFLCASARHRRALRTPWPWLSLAVAQAAMAPVYVWNAQHGFASFLFQSRDRAYGGFHPGVRNLAGLLGTQAALLGPVLLVALGLVLLRAPRLRHPRPLFLAAFCLPLFALCLGLSVGTLVKPNWMLPCYPTGVLLVARVLPRRWAARSLGVSAALHALALIEILAYPVPIRSDDTWVGWRALAAQVSRLADDNPGAFLFSADQYKTTAELLFYQPRKVYGPNVIGERGLEFDYVDTEEDLRALRGRDALYIDSAPRDATRAWSGGPGEAVLRRFERCTELPPILIERGGAISRKFFAYRCAGYRGPRGG
ncbi:MAG: glycosyltransferase family 39 protein [Myxococcales bacterium]